MNSYPLDGMKGNNMSEENNSTESLSDIGDMVEEAVASNEESAEESSEEEVSTEESTEESEVEVAASADEEDSGDTSIEEQKEEELNNMLRKLKLKVDGEEIEEEIDLSDEENLIKQLQMAKVAQKRMHEKATLEKDVQQLLADLKENPLKVLADPDIGVDVKEMIEQFVQKELEDSEKSPEQKKQEALESELEQLRSEREKEKVASEQREMEGLKKQYFDEYNKKIDDMLKDSDIPRSPYVDKKIADYMLMALDEGYEDAEPKDVWPVVREEIINEIQSMVRLMPEETVEGLIGKEFFDNRRKREIEKAKAKKTPATAKKAGVDTGESSAKGEKEASKKTFKEFFGT